MTNKDKAYSGILLLMPLILFAPQYFSDQVMAWLDFSFYFLPFRMLTADYIQQGIMPFWNPFIYCGNPLMANMQSAVFYPLNIFYHVLPPILAVKITTWIIFAVMAVFTYAFMRLYDASEEGSFTASVIFAFGFYSMIKAVEFAEINVMGWLPAALYFTKRYAISARRQDCFMIAFMLCLSLLGGHAQFFIYAWLVFALFFIYENVYAKKFRRMDGVKDFLVINLLLLGLSVIQLLPTANFVMLSKRAAGGIGYAGIMEGFLSFDHVLAFVFPFLNGFFSWHSYFLNWIGFINAGIFPVLLLFLGAFMIKEGRLRVFLGLAFVLFLFMTFMGRMPFYRALFEAAPFLAAFNYQSKAVLGLFFVMCLVIAKGFDGLFTGTRAELKGFVRFSYVFFGLVLAAYLFAEFYRNNILIFYRNTFNPSMTMQMVYDAVHLYDYALAGFLAFTTILGAALLVIHIAGNEIRRGPATKTAAVIVALISLFAFQNWAEFYYFKNDFYKNKTKQTDFMVSKSSIGQARVLAPALFTTRDLNVQNLNSGELAYYCADRLTPNFPMYHKLKNVDGFDSLFPGGFASFKSCFNTTAAPWDMPAFSLFSAKYIASSAKISGQYLKLASTGFADIYENSNYLEPAFLVKYPYETAVAANEEAKGIISGKTFDPLRTVVFETRPPDFKPYGVSAGAAGETSVITTMPDPNSYLIKSRSPSPGVLILTDNYYPGWRAFVDGVEAKIMKVDMTFKGVYLSAGTHEVHFKYSPPEFFIGALISVILLLLLIPVVPLILVLF